MKLSAFYPLAAVVAISALLVAALPEPKQQVKPQEVREKAHHYIEVVRQKLAERKIR